MMHTIRPHKVFNQLDDATSKLVMPRVGAPILLETSILIALYKIANAKKVFEFGTYLGINTLNFAMNLPSDGVVFTIDLDAPVEKGHATDKFVMDRFFDAKAELAYLNTEYEEQVKQIFCDSTKYDFTKLHNSFDFIFIDGGHDVSTLTQDTATAIKLCKSGGIVTWHDYGNPEHPELTKFLDEFSKSHDLWFVEDTKIVYMYLKEQ